jgi:phosphoglycolate phosphatase
MARYPDRPRSCYVGDTRGDMLEGARAGATPLGAGWGWHGAAALREAGAAYVAATPAELLAYFMDGVSTAR